MFKSVNISALVLGFTSLFKTAMCCLASATAGKSSVYIKYLF